MVNKKDAIEIILYAEENECQWPIKNRHFWPRKSRQLNTGIIIPPLHEYEWAAPNGCVFGSCRRVG
jgi:hypothetical protein